MNIFQRIKKILLALMMILAALIFLVSPADAALLTIIVILALGLAAKGIKDIIFYFRMARHMVGGKLILFQGVLVLDFALLTLSFYNIPKIFMLLYLAGVHAFSGVVEILRAMEARRTVDGPWKLKFAHGVVNIALAAVCMIFISNISIAVLIYSAGLVYSAGVMIFDSFRRTSFVLIE